MTKAHIAVFDGDSIGEFRDIDTALVPFPGYDSAVNWLRKARAVCPVTVIISIPGQGFVNIVVSKIPEI